MSFLDSTFHPSRMIQLFIILIIPVMILVPVSTSGEEDVEQDIPVAASIEFYQLKAVPYIDPTLNQWNETVNVVVTCHFSSPGIFEVEVDLRVDAGGWEYEGISPLRFGRCVSIQEVSFNIHIPPGQRTGEYPYSINGTWKTIPEIETGELNKIRSKIVVDQYTIFNLKDIDNKKVKAGTTFSTILPVENNGNGDDLIRYTIPDQEKFEDRGWTFISSPLELSILFNGTGYLPLIIEIPSDEKPGKYEVELSIFSPRAQSLGEKNSINGNSTIEIEVLNNYRDEIILFCWIVSPIILLISLSILFSVIYNEIKHERKKKFIMRTLGKRKV